MRRAALLLLATLVLASCGGDEATQQEAVANDAIVDLDNVLALASDFRADEGKTRVLLLLSPT